MNNLSPQPNPYFLAGQWLGESTTDLVKLEAVEQLTGELSFPQKIERGVAAGKFIVAGSVIVGGVISEILERLLGPPPVVAIGPVVPYKWVPIGPAVPIRQNS